MEGVNAKLILNQTKLNNKSLCSKTELIRIIENENFEVLVTMGAGDIDKLVDPIREILVKREIRNSLL